VIYPIFGCWFTLTRTRALFDVCHDVLWLASQPSTSRNALKAFQGRQYLSIIIFMLVHKDRASAWYFIPIPRKVPLAIVKVEDIDLWPRLSLDQVHTNGFAATLTTILPQNILRCRSDSKRMLNSCTTVESALDHKWRPPHRFEPHACCNLANGLRL
jgi:hypothetical protein